MTHSPFLWEDVTFFTWKARRTVSLTWASHIEQAMPSIFAVVLYINAPFLTAGASPQRHIQHHHDGKAQRKGQGPRVRVLALGHFGDQFFHHHIEHGPG